MCLFVIFLWLGRALPFRVCFYEFSRAVSPTVYACLLFYTRQMSNRVFLLLLGSSLVNLPNFNVVYFTTTLVHLAPIFLPSACYTQLAPEVSRISQRPSCSCSCDYFYCLYNLYA